MKLPEDPNERKAAIIAACVTIGMALVILVLLFIFTLGGDRRELAAASMPETQDNEEVYLEPEFLEPEFMDPEPLDAEDGAEDGAEFMEESAPQPEGEPEFSEEPQDIRTDDNRVVPEEQPKYEKPESKPAPKNIPETVTTPQPNVPSGGESKDLGDERKKISDGMVFNPDKNGNNDNNSSANTGSGGDGSVNTTYDGVGGRKGKIPVEKVEARSPVTVKVKIKVNADGIVVGTPEVISGGSKSQREACIRMAKNSTWTKKKGAPDEEGTITFNINPK